MIQQDNGQDNGQDNQSALSSSSGTLYVVDPRFSLESCSFSSDGRGREQHMYIYMIPPCPHLTDGVHRDGGGLGACVLPPQARDTGGHTYMYIYIIRLHALFPHTSSGAATHTHTHTFSSRLTSFLFLELCFTFHI